MTLLELTGVTKRFPIRRGWWRSPVDWVHAVTDVSLRVDVGETVAIVGESGCGKSTLARVMAQLYTPDAGDVYLAGRRVTRVTRAQRRELAALRQVVFQDPAASVNPRWTVRALLEEPLVVHRLGSTAQRVVEVERMLDSVGLSPALLERFPHELSGGQRQRINIARAMLLRPKLLIADEPVSALDVSVQGEILNTMRDVQAQTRVGIVLITHDLRVAAHMAHRIAVMYLGRIVEVIAAARLAHAQHPYTRALLHAVPTLRGVRTATPLRGDPPSPIHLPPGCAFAGRCPRMQPACRDAVPAWRGADASDGVACINPHANHS